jgi:copper chaperone CopZ
MACSLVRAIELAATGHLFCSRNLLPQGFRAAANVPAETISSSKTQPANWILSDHVVRKEQTMKTQEFHISGMHCDACALAIRDALHSTAGVHHVDVTFSGKTAWIEYDEQVVQPGTLLKKIQDLGYNATVGDTAAAHHR